MPKLTRRNFMAASAAAVSARSVPQIVAKPATRRILTLVYDKSLGMMRAIDRVVLR
ncbi:MAG TPA: twin-arginine translocation signal domain-containing protein [Rhodobacteraceae bacterium]|nr:twin-arginine translocation signal domain-containing protein [Paracoccaceae bacterium]